MIEMKPIDIDGRQVLGIEVKLPKTTLLVITTDKGYIMCGALDIALLNERLSDRNIIAARAVGVRTLEQLLDAPLESVTHTAESMGITSGMTGKEALVKMM
ncbi:MULTISPECIES: YunC family protein [unclassified Thermoactinomyces]|uniref:YunC family protein n=1 Tax=unclassified Thermoactinomyces TaxID=2634588 RepID=UPI0018DBB283|nr:MULTISPECIES: DUF1805 domain-containing protein [unclassified Thermoactinomyces]MBH8599010.1 DUF1805 domain-containing protein [Thermoactinomyces sp. CICC 10523]MBH8604997.1 DUF1805 domain-containing protein [Thermoactinomyces sp. CICC 10522]MBH8608437.1 DUF1805 domain-containing protein [Thermoactinomyces sp. CICC 10521]